MVVLCLYDNGDELRMQAMETEDPLTTVELGIVPDMLVGLQENSRRFW